MQQKYNHAKISVDNRPVEVAARIEALEREMELLCITGVEDKLVQTIFTVLMVLLKALLALLEYIFKVLLGVGFDDQVKVFMAWVVVCLHNIVKFCNPNSQNSKYDVALQID